MRAALAALAALGAFQAFSAAKAAVAAERGAYYGAHDVPEQTPWQAKLAARVEKSAAKLSAAAEGPLLELLGSSSFREGLAACCPSLCGLAPAELLRRLQAELRVSEVVTGFPAVTTPAKGDRFGWWDFDMLQGYNMQILENQWQVRLLHNGSFHNGRGWFRMQDDAEVQIYGLRPFSKRGQPANFAEASERGPYCMVNALRVDAGSPLYGDVSAVLYPSRAREVAMISAVDTGSFEGMCNGSNNDAAAQMLGFGRGLGAVDVRSTADGPLKHNCSAFPPSADHLGTMEHYNHLLLINDAYWDSRTGPRPLLSTFARAVAEPASQIRGWGNGYALRGIDLVRYFEAIPAASLHFPHAVKFLIGKFPALFGTLEGAALQQWCIAQGWVLVWSLGLNVADEVGPDGLNFFNAPDLKGRYPSNKRLLDATVLANTSASKNVSFGGSAVAAFNEVWLAAQRERAVAVLQNSMVPDARWEDLFSQLSDGLPPAARLEPLRAGSCADEERCIGTDWAGHCVCYAAEAQAPASHVDAAGVRRGGDVFGDGAVVGETAIFV